MKTAEELFLEKYGNKITASESWVIRFAEEYASQFKQSLPEDNWTSVDFALPSKNTKVWYKSITGKEDVGFFDGENFRTIDPIFIEEIIAWKPYRLYT